MAHPRFIGRARRSDPPNQRTRWRRWFTCAVGCLALTQTATAQTPTQPGGPRVSLSFVGIAECPTEEVFRELVAARLGYVPFVDSTTVGAATATVTFERCAAPACAGYRALLRTSDAASGSGDVHDTMPARRETRVLASADCNVLASSAAMTLAIAIDPDSAVLANRGATAPVATTTAIPSYGVPAQPESQSAPRAVIQWPSIAPRAANAAPDFARVPVHFVSDDNVPLQLYLRDMAPRSRWQRRRHEFVCVSPCDAMLPLGTVYLALSEE